MLFLPPLLFFDGWRLPKAGLLRDKGTILALALGLVVFTVLGLGLLIHWMIPAMPLAVAFALAAVISPTDPVAVKAIAERVPVPKRLMRILEGEALLNDASGLVCMRFAVAAALTGTFSLVDAVGDFVWVSAGGLAIGWAVTVVVAQAKNLVSRHYGEDVGAQILISLLIPFGAYFLADLAGTSGILAAVAAGMTMGYVEQGGSALAETRVRRSVVWETIQFGASGVIFILLGEQLPALQAARPMSCARPAMAKPSGCCSTSQRLHWACSPCVSPGYGCWCGSRCPRPASDWRLVAALTLGGVRGTVTLAGILSLPLMLADGSALPGARAGGVPCRGRDHRVAGRRDRPAAGPAASSSVPGRARGGGGRGWAPGWPPERLPWRRSAVPRAGLRTPPATPISAPKRPRAPWRSTASASMRWPDPAPSGTPARSDRRTRAELELAGIRAERERLLELVRAGRLSDEVARKLVREVDLVEARIGAS